MILDMNLNDVYRFWTFVVKTDTCWFWTGALTWNGYGRFKLNRVTQRAHCIAYLMHTRKPIRHQINHSCDSPNCVNPEHLWDGTQSENIKDAFAKGRGARNYLFKTTDSDVREIRQLSKDGNSLDYIAGRFQLSKGHVCELIKNKRRIGI